MARLESVHVLVFGRVGHLLSYRGENRVDLCNDHVFLSRRWLTTVHKIWDLLS
jgi:hypothetical protein